jgi:integrase
MLTDAAIRRLKPKPTPFKRSDSLALYLLVNPNGARLWRMNYRVAGRQKTLALGAYPDVSLSEAREARDLARRTLRQGLDPSAVVKAEKQAVVAALASSFAAVADEWLDLKIVKERKSASTERRARWLIETLNGDLGSRPVAEIEPPELLTVLRRVEAAGNHETVARLRAVASKIFRFGIATSRCKRDIAADLRGATTSATPTPHPAVTEPTDIGELLRAIDTLPLLMRHALLILALTFVRPGELLLAQWPEIEGDVWNIPAERTKMRRPHRVPLSREALVELAGLRQITGHRKYLIASLRKPGRPQAVGVFNRALYQLGFGGVHVAHGFRATASTILNESGLWAPDAIESQLAHAPRNKVRAAYNRARYWPERVEMMRWYGNLLAQLHGHGEVVELPKRITRHRA